MVGTKVMANTIKMHHNIKSIVMAFPAALFALSLRFIPRFFGIVAFIPTPIPMAIAWAICCIGIANDTAVKASSDILATNIESTILYIA